VACLCHAPGLIRSACAKGFSEAGQILWTRVNEPAAWRVNVRDEHERDGDNER
jgi:hypothetical protein